MTWRPIGFREVNAPTFLRQTAIRWRQCCQPHAPAALYPQVSFLRFLVLISVRLITLIVNYGVDCKFAINK
jgi:hypothetical protein